MNQDVNENISTRYSGPGSFQRSDTLAVGEKQLVQKPLTIKVVGPARPIGAKSELSGHAFMPFAMVTNCDQTSLPLSFQVTGRSLGFLMTTRKAMAKNLNVARTHSIFMASSARSLPTYRTVKVVACTCLALFLICVATGRLSGKFR